MKENQYRKGRGFAIGLALGMPLGFSIGLAMDNLAVGPAIGLALGAGLGAAMERSYRKREEMETPGRLKEKRIFSFIIIGVLAVGIIAMLALYIFARLNKN